jgi:hypothetical protein
VTTILLGDESALLPLLLLLRSDFFSGEPDGLSTSSDSLPPEGMILTSAGFGGGDLSDCLSPK